MPMTQDDIRRHYETSWKATSDAAASEEGLAYSDPVEDAVLYPAYAALLRDLRVPAGRVLDVGCGSGRWVRFLVDRLAPRSLHGIDFTQAAVDLLCKWSPPTMGTRLTFERADITQPGLTLTDTGPFDLINIANVLFHIPEAEKFKAALTNLANLVSADGLIVTTEYLPRVSMRTQWMLVRSRYEFEAAVKEAGLRIVDVRATAFFSNDPMGIDGPDTHCRAHFATVRAARQMLMKSPMDAQNKTFFNNLFAEIERAALTFCAERIAPIDMPSQKLVALARAS